MARNSMVSFSNDARRSSSLLEQLRCLDTASLCDADKVQAVADSNSNYLGLRLMEGLQLRNPTAAIHISGIARTVQLTESNDFLAVFRGLAESHKDEVLVVNTLNSTKAVAGELFCAEAARRGVVGLVIDGPMRDTAYLDEFANSVACYSRSVTPYSGTTQSVGDMQVAIDCGGVAVHPGDLVVGDCEGIIVGSVDTFERVLPVAQEIQRAEREIKRQVSEGTILHSLTNYEEHLEARLSGRPSALEFRV